MQTTTNNKTSSTAMEAKLNSYERRQLKAIEAWKNEEPGILSESISLMTLPLTWAATVLVPVKLVQSVLDTVNSLSEQLTLEDNILKKAGVKSVSELRSRDLKLSDSLATTYQEEAMILSGASGAALGATGVGGLVLDIGALLTISLKTIHKIGFCYGHQKLDKQFVLAILAAANTSGRADRIKVVDTLHQLEEMLIEDVVEDGIKDLIKSKIAHAGGFFTVREVTKGVGRKLARRKAVQIVPLVGAVLGGATNVSFLSDVGRAARHIFQECWLRDNGRLPSIS